MQGFDLSTISNCYIGGAQASAIYLGSSKIWPATQHDYSQDPLTFEVLEAGQFKFKYSSANTSQLVMYSLDNGTHWTMMSDDTWTATIPAGSKMIFDCYEPTVDSNHGMGTFSSTGRFNVSGNIGSLLEGYMAGGLDPDNPNSWPSLSNYQFEVLFKDCTYLISAEHLYLPTGTIIDGCYNSMFDGCTSLTTAPALPATTLVFACYYAMFRNCTSLTTAPALPATTLAHGCYYAMFDHCTSLTTAPALPATTLAEGCYGWMFNSCTSLTTAPALPATTLAKNCYNAMFQGCTSLTTAPALSATTLVYACYCRMFESCTSLTTAPALPATTLADMCYNAMFWWCANLNSITCLATDISAGACTSGWVESVSATGTFTKAASMNDWVIDSNNGIPTGWTVVNAPNT